ncbi:hypothetical protein D3C81_680050 [compost metagenome]
MREFGVLAQQFVGAVGLAQQFDGMPIKRLPSRRGNNAMHAALEQLHAHVLFQVAHLLADGWLRDMQRFTGAGDVPALDHLDEIPQLAQVHVYLPSHMIFR